MPEQAGKYLASWSSECIPNSFVIALGPSITVQGLSAIDNRSTHRESDIWYLRVFVKN